MPMVNDNGDVYGWGDNSRRTLTRRNVDKISFSDRVLIARQIKDIEMFKENALFLLDKKGNLCFSGQHYYN